MNDLQKELQELKAKVADLESRIVAEPVKWQPKGGEWWINESGAITSRVESIESMREFGIERPTQQQAERAAVEMRKFNRLLALRDELCGDDLPDWESKISDKWRVYCDNKHGKWNVGKDRYMQDVGVYFTKEEHARRACDMLNSGKVEL
jgi:hypothetical protein